MLLKKMRLVSLILLMTMLLSLLIGCDGGSHSLPPDSTPLEPGKVPVEEDTTDLYDSKGFLKDSLPEDFGHTQDTVKFLYWKDAENKEYDITSLSGSDIVNNALYYRNETVAERMKIEYEFVGVNGNYDNSSVFTQTLSSAIDTGERYDLVSAYSMVMAVCARDGMLANLHGTYVDLEKPWWPTMLTESCQIGDALYFTSGDASVNTLYSMYCCYFNIALLADYHPDVNLYEIVKSDKWTFGEMLTLMEGVYRDGGAQGKDVDGDTFGMVGTNLYCSAMIDAFGFENVVNSGKELVLSPDWDSAEVDSAIKSLQNMFNSDYAILDATTAVRNSFNDNRSLFAILYANQAAKRFSKTKGLSYGVVPLPKLDTTQESYITPVANPASFYGIASNCADITFVSAVLECWASEGYRQVSPALFEKSFKLMYSESSDNALMYDYIRNGMKFNLGRLLKLAANKEMEVWTLQPTLDGVSVSWLTLTAAKKDAMNETLRKLNEAFKNRT